jgi:hypothetical protein
LVHEFFSGGESHRHRVIPMSFQWLSWSNPVALWWGFLLAVSVVNIGLWLLVYRYFQGPREHRRGAFHLEPLVLLCAAYVFGCAFRSVLPRTDVGRLCLFDGWLSSVMLGRSVATVAEICFVAQWAIILHLLARTSQSGLAHAVARVVVPLIVLAEGFSWYAVITTNYLGNTIENSLWAVTFLLIAVALVALLDKFTGVVQMAIAAALVGVIGYVIFMISIDVPMYFDRWQADLTSGKELLGVIAGLHDARTHWVVSHDVARWDGEIVWMSLYFSFAVWGSLGLCGVLLIRDRLPEYLATAARARRGPALARPSPRASTKSIPGT